MRNVGRVFFTMVAGLTLVVAVWAFAPVTTNEAALLGLSASQDAAQQQSVSGKIASVEKNSFTLTVGQSQTSNEKNNLQSEPGNPKTMTFQLDKNTTIEGSLKVGANADVTYRQEKGANIAISVHVTP
jgi:Cu/Ag efflux protein CusF